MTKLFPYIDGLVQAADCRKRREKDWVGIIVHHTGFGQTIPDWKKFFKNITAWLAKKDDVYASAHFHISRDGVVDQIVDPREYEAFHAGKSRWWHPVFQKAVPDWNRYAIGIELNGDGNRIDYTWAQYKQLAMLTCDLKKEFPTIDLDHCLVGHSDIAPGRKFDPGSRFNWDYFRALVSSELKFRDKK